MNRTHVSELWEENHADRKTRKRYKKDLNLEPFFLFLPKPNQFQDKRLSSGVWLINLKQAECSMKGRGFKQLQSDGQHDEHESNMMDEQDAVTYRVAAVTSNMQTSNS